MEYEFKLTFKINTEDCDHDSIMSLLGEAGCTDALVGLGVAGHIGLEFIREASCARTAVWSAIADVRKALPLAKMVEACPDLVGLTDVAEMVGVSRQNMRKLMTTHPDNFPSPVHGGSTSIWHLADILDFMEKRNLAAPSPMLEVARTTMQINLAKERLLHKASLSREVEKFLAA